jgi:hypothetical protein
MISFKSRGFVSLVSTFSFLISLVSGIVLYFTPQGRIAHWVNWTFWGLEKETWGALHINSSLVFFIVILFHIYFNWKLLWGYLKKRTKMALNLKTEFAITLLLSVFMIVASVRGIQPFKQIIDWNDEIKVNYAANAENEPPIPHAEELTVDEFCEKLNLSLEKFENKARQNSWDFENNDKIGDIAKRNNISPSDIYRALQVQKLGQGRSGNSGGRSAGWGRLTLQQVCDQNSIDVKDAIKQLENKGINATPELGIRFLASQAGWRPSQIIEVITGKEIVH